MTNGFDKIDKPFTATLTKKGREPIDVNEVGNITYDISSRSYLLTDGAGQVLQSVGIDELDRVELSRTRKSK